MLFRFKRFSVRQDRCPMKVGTDGVLLGAWVEVRSSDRRILDIGTGTGLIALMLAQRTERFGMRDTTDSVRTGDTDDGMQEISDLATAVTTPLLRQDVSVPHIGSELRTEQVAGGAIVPNEADNTGPIHSRVRITGVDMDDVSQARENADASPWGARMEFVQLPVQTFHPDERFDLIVSNPPYFVDSLTCPNPGRTLARHARSLPYEELCEAVVRLLAPGGRFAVILPASCAARFLEIGRGKLTPVRRTEVRTTPRHPVKRVLMEFTATGGSGFPVCGVACPASGSRPDARSHVADVTTLPVEPAVVADELVIGTGVHEQYTDAYRALTQDFYLKF